MTYHLTTIRPPRPEEILDPSADEVVAATYKRLRSAQDRILPFLAQRAQLSREIACATRYNRDLATANIASGNEELYYRYQHMAKLQEQFEELRRTITKISYSTIQEDADTYGKLACRAICTRVQATLPRELRDIIYDNLNASAINFAPEFDFVESVQKSYFQHRLTQPSRAGRRGPPHWWHEEYVGPEFAKELAEHHYRIVRFIFTPDDLSLLSRFLDFDVWGKNVIPADELRRLAVRIGINAIKDAESKQQLLHNLEQLQCVKNKGLEIAFQVERHPQHGKVHWHEVLRVIAPLVRHLREKGYTSLKFQFVYPGKGAFDITPRFESIVGGAGN